MGKCKQPNECTDSANCALMKECARCAGMNCTSTDGQNHSPECRAEHAAAVAGGRFVKSGAIQQKAIDHGFKYWRAPDAHGVTATGSQAIDLLQDLLGVEVGIEGVTYSLPPSYDHPDSVAVNAFASAMKDKLESAREKGRGGWQECDPADLSRMLREHVEKGDPRDVANFCMFLWHLDAPISPAAIGQKLTEEQISTVIDEWYYHADEPVKEKLASFARAILSYSASPEGAQP